MNCPMCGHEDVTKECPACGKIIVPASLDLVAVKSFDNPLEAHAARAFLEAEGIQAFISDSEMVGAASYLGNALGYVKVEVPRDDAEKAAERLRNAKTVFISLWLLPILLMLGLGALAVLMGIMLQAPGAILAVAILIAFAGVAFYLAKWLTTPRRE